MTLYEAIFKRKSVRTYRMEELPEELLHNIRKYEKEIDRMYPQLRYELVIFNAVREKVPMKGLFRVKAPYYMALFIEDKEGHMEEAGYILEQLVLFMTTKGIATCYQGGARLQENISFPGLKLSMIVAFGFAEGAMYRREKEAKRLPMESIAFVKEAIGDDVRMFLRAGRMAPSSLNSQPWRLMVYNNRIHIFTKRNMREAEASRIDRLNTGILAAHFAVTAEEFWMKKTFKVSESVKKAGFKNNCYITTLYIEN